MRGILTIYRESQKRKIKNHLDDFYKTVETLLKEHIENLQDNVIKDPYDKICELLEQL